MDVLQKLRDLCATLTGVTSTADDIGEAISDINENIGEVTADITTAGMVKQSINLSTLTSSATLADVIAAHNSLVTSMTSAGIIAAE